jgi:DNA polymerase III delta prime subunit
MICEKEGIAIES